MKKSRTVLPKLLQKSGILSLLSGLCLWLYYHPNNHEPKTTIEHGSSRNLISLLPSINDGILVQHAQITLSYSQKHKQAEWVAYELSKNKLSAKKLSRSGFSFIPDPKIASISALPSDYIGSGYDRGHLCPAADMAYDSIALLETFYMSNISPQSRAFNQGVWREIESKSRAWASTFGNILVITGPILSKPGLESIGKNKVTAPIGFFKVLFVQEHQQAIGFIVPNQRNEKDPLQYAFHVDYLEEITNIDFFPNLPLETQSTIESRLDLSFWNNSSPQKNSRPYLHGAAQLTEEGD
jgi:endonuclease G